MKVQGTHAFQAPRELVWRALLDPEVLARTLPGCEKLERVGEDEMRGALNVQVGPVKGQFQGTLRLTDLRPLEGYRMKLRGEGPAGFMEGEGDLRLAGEGSETTLTYDLDAQVGGRIAGVGQRLLDSSARSIARQGLEGLGRELEALKQAGAASTAGMAAAPPAVVPPPRPTQAEVAARVAGDVARDLVPPRIRPWVVVGGLALLVLVIVVMVRACG